MLSLIRNQDGMECYSSYIVRTFDAELCAMDLIGPETAVKAIWASVMMKKPIWRGYTKILPSPFTLTTIRERAGLVRWHIVPQIEEEVAIIYGWEQNISFGEALYGVLSRYSIWPVIREWQSALVSLGQEHNLIRPLWADGCDYAYRVELTGWDNALNDGIARGLLTV